MRQSHAKLLRDVPPTPRYGSPGSMLSSVSYGYLSGIKQSYNSRHKDPVNPSAIGDPRFRGGRLPPLPNEAWARQQWNKFFFHETGGRYGMSLSVDPHKAKEKGRKIGQEAGYVVGLYKAFGKPYTGAVLPSKIARIGVDQFNAIIDKHNAKIREHNRELHAQQRGKSVMKHQHSPYRKLWTLCKKAGFDPQQFKAPMLELRSATSRLQQFSASSLSSALRNESQRLAKEKQASESRHANDVWRMYGMSISRIVNMQKQVDDDLRFGRFENVVRDIRKLSTQARNIQRDLKDESNGFKRPPYNASVGNTVAQAAALSGAVASESAKLYNRATQAMRQYIAANERQRRSTSSFKQSVSGYPLGTLKLLAQTMPKEIRSLKIAQSDLRQAGSAVAGVHDQRVKQVVSILRRLDSKLSQQISDRQSEFKEIAVELRNRGNSAADIVQLAGRRSANTKVDIGPVRIRVVKPKQIAKLKEQIKDIQIRIKLTDQQVKTDSKTVSQVDRAASFLESAAHELELAENMIPGTQMGTLTLRFGNAMRRMDSAYQAIANEVRANQAELKQLRQKEQQLRQALHNAGG